MKAKIRLDTLTDVQGFVNAVSTVLQEVHLSDGHKLTVSAKSILGAIYTMEWSDVYCVCERDIYHLIHKYLVEE